MSYILIAWDFWSSKQDNDKDFLRSKTTFWGDLQNCSQMVTKRHRAGRVLLLLLHELIRECHLGIVVFLVFNPITWCMLLWPWFFDYIATLVCISDARLLILQPYHNIPCVSWLYWVLGVYRLRKRVFFIWVTEVWVSSSIPTRSVGRGFVSRLLAFE